MKIITLHVEESTENETGYGELADILNALAEQHFGPRDAEKGGTMQRYVEDIADAARRIEYLYQHRPVRPVEEE